MHNKHLVRLETSKSEYLYGIAPKQYGSRKAKADDIQSLKTRLLYDLIRQKRLSHKSTFADLISNYDLLVHIISFLSLQIVDLSKKPISIIRIAISNLSIAINCETNK